MALGRDALEDAATARKVLAGDGDAFRALVDRYQSRVYHCVRRVVRDPEEAEDVAQEAFVRAFTRLGDYNERWTFATWLLTIATRMALNTVRARHGRPAESLEDLPPGAEPFDAGANPLEGAARNEWLDRLRKEIEGLGARMRLIFTMRHEDDLSIREIARATDSSESAIKVTLHRARKILKERLKEFSDYA